MDSEESSSSLAIAEKGTIIKQTSHDNDSPNITNNDNLAVVLTSCPNNCKALAKKKYNKKDKPTKIGFSYVYRDFSKTPDDPVAQSSKYSHTGRLRTQNTFPVKLHSIIERSEIDNYSHIISWQPHGRSFIVHNNSMLLEHVLKKYFFISKFSSFQRQLNIYGFHKISKGREAGSYCHELFMRGRSGLCPGILRLKSRPSFHWKDEPNFYNFDPLDEIATAAIAHHRKPSTETTSENKKLVTKPSPKSIECLKSDSEKVTENEVRQHSKYENEKINKSTLSNQKVYSSSAIDSSKGDKLQENLDQSGISLQVEYIPNSNPSTLLLSSSKSEKAKTCNHDQSCSYAMKKDANATNETSKYKNANNPPYTCPLRKLSEIIDTYT